MKITRDDKKLSLYVQELNDQEIADKLGQDNNYKLEKKKFFEIY